MIFVDEFLNIFNIIFSISSWFRFANASLSIPLRYFFSNSLLSFDDTLLKNFWYFLVSLIKYFWACERICALERVATHSLIYIDSKDNMWCYFLPVVSVFQYALYKSFVFVGLPTPCSGVGFVVFGWKVFCVLWKKGMSCYMIRRNGCTFEGGEYVLFLFSGDELIFLIWFRWVEIKG